MSQAGTETVDERVLALKNLSISVLEDLAVFLKSSEDLPASVFLDNLGDLVDGYLVRDDISESDKQILSDFLSYSSTAARVPKWLKIVKAAVAIVVAAIELYNAISG